MLFVLIARGDNYIFVLVGHSNNNNYNKSILAAWCDLDPHISHIIHLPFPNKLQCSKAQNTSLYHSDVYYCSALKIERKRRELRYLNLNYFGVRVQKSDILPTVTYTLITRFFLPTYTLI